jgi:hypothetical protein
MHANRHHRARLGVWLLGALVVTAGCSDMLGPERLATARVGGRVTIGGRQPVGDRWIELLPAGGTVGELAIGRLSRDGRFEVVDAPIGDVAIRISGRPIDPTGSPNLDRYLFEVGRAYLIPRTIGRTNAPIEIDLLREFEQIAGRRRP